MINATSIPIPPMPKPQCQPWDLISQPEINGAINEPMLIPM